MDTRHINKLLIIGTGFSAPLGVPVMRDFFRQAWRLLGEAGPCVPERAMLGGHALDVPVFRELQRAWLEWQPPDPSHRQDLERFAMHVGEQQPDARWDLGYVMSRTFQVCMEQWLEAKGCTPWQDLYRRLARDLAFGRDRIAVLSFNYDLILDQALLQEELMPEYGFPTVWIADLNERCLHRDRPLLTLKPNGSINWLVCENQSCPRITVDWHPGPECSKPGNWQTGYNLSATHHVRGIHLFPLVSPPEQEAGEHAGWPVDLLSSVRRSVDALLPQIESVMFIGWSAPETDVTYRYKFRNGLLGNCRTVTVVNYCGDDLARQEVKDRYVTEVIPPGIQPYWWFDGLSLDFLDSDNWRRFLS